RGRIVFSAAIDGRMYARHGTNVDTRLTVIDRVPADDPTAFPHSPGMARDLTTLLEWSTTFIPARVVTRAPSVAPRAEKPTVARPVAGRPRPHPPARSVATFAEPSAVELPYEPVNWVPAQGQRIADALYEGYALQSIRVSGSQAHPTRLVQSAAMASV